MSFVEYFIVSFMSHSCRRVIRVVVRGPEASFVAGYSPSSMARGQCRLSLSDVRQHCLVSTTTTVQPAAAFAFQYAGDAPRGETKLELTMDRATSPFVPQSDGPRDLVRGSDAVQGAAHALAMAAATSRRSAAMARAFSQLRGETLWLAEMSQAAAWASM